MELHATLLLRKEELERRVEGLPLEVQAWKQRSEVDLDKNAHFSQMQALGVLMDAFVERQRATLKELATSPEDDSFRTTALRLVGQIIKAQSLWDFFRSKLELRFSPDFKDMLWVADTVAWDCYQPVMQRAIDAGIVQKAEVREPPLTYLIAGFSPATWVRGTHPTDAENAAFDSTSLPIPVIQIPWDHVENAWELLSLHHEVGHDIEADLRLSPALQGSLQQTLITAGVPIGRIQTWLGWEAEVFADLVGLQLAGPAFAEELAHLLMLPTAMVIEVDPRDPHPTHYPRILMNAAYARTLAPNHPPVQDEATDLEATWTGLYGDRPEFAPFVGDFQHVFKALMDTPLPVLKDKTVRELMPYSAGDDAKIRLTADFLLTGQNAPAKGSIPPRFCVSSGRLAVMKASENGGDLPGALNAINQRLIELVRDQAPQGLRASDDSTPHKQFIAGFAERL